METNRKIAEWLGFKVIPALRGGYRYQLPHEKSGCSGIKRDWENKDSDAITLLPVLVNRRYRWSMRASLGNVELVIKDKNINTVGYGFESTISAAICSALTALIDKEKGGAE